mmetsp:Transcript_9166/g.25700  ORF Transcript_9166/g.25700 Transcript_9166/m.25700 type:complete len:497 (-) Transcript_9166:3-1493(-)
MADLGTVVEFLAGEGDMDDVMEPLDVPDTYEAKVFKVEWLELPYVLKRHHDEASAVREAKLMQKLGGVAVVSFAGLYRDRKKRVYVVMERLRMDLHKLVCEIYLHKEPALTRSTALRLCLRLYEYLDYLHRRGLAHNDLKPDNIFVFYESNRFSGKTWLDLKLGDLGFAFAYKDKMDIGEDDVRVSHRNGTNPFIAPEVGRKTRNGQRMRPSPSADMYAWAVICTMLLRCDDTMVDILFQAAEPSRFQDFDFRGFLTGMDYPEELVDTLASIITAPGDERENRAKKVKVALEDEFEQAKAAEEAAERAPEAKPDSTMGPSIPSNDQNAIAPSWELLLANVKAAGCVHPPPQTAQKLLLGRFGNDGKKAFAVFEEYRRVFFGENGAPKGQAEVSRVWAFAASLGAGGGEGLADSIGALKAKGLKKFTARHWKAFRVCRGDEMATLAYIRCDEVMREPMREAGLGTVDDQVVDVYYQQLCKVDATIERLRQLRNKNLK